MDLPKIQYAADDEEDEDSITHYGDCCRDLSDESDESDLEASSIAKVE